MTTDASRTMSDSATGDLRFAILGPVELRIDGQLVDAGVYKQRALLARLLIDKNAVVSTDRLIDDLWGDSTSKDPQNALWVVVSRLRSVLEPDRPRRSDGTVLLTRSPGYLIQISDDALDSTQFEQLAQEGRSLLETSPDRASAALTSALALWRGRPLEEFLYEEWASAEVARLDELRLATVEDRIDADLRLGRSRELVSELESLTRQHPSRQRLTGHLMLALHRSGRQGDALRAFGTLRTYLAEELGLEPSAELASLEERIVLDDPELIEVHAVRQLSGRAEPGLSVRGYELRATIGAGQTGTVHRAFQPSIGREVAIKIIGPELADNPDFIRRFEAEVRSAAQLEHPQVVPIFDFWREPGAAYLVTPYFPRQSLAELLTAGPLDTAVAATVIEQVGTALAAAHQRGVVHGNVKPENVLLDHESTAHLTDFGLGFDVGDPDDMAETMSSGHRAPETRAGELTRSSDLYSFAVLAERTLGGSVGSESVADSPLVGPAAAVVARAMAADPDERHPDVESFVDELLKALGANVDPSIAVEVSNPYRGLRAFAEADADHFFGRERLVERLLTRLGHSGTTARFVALVGPSGSGKSSVIRAGLVPAIRSGALTGSDRWFITTMVPGVHPFESLEGALRRIATNPPNDLLERLTDRGLADAVEAINPDRSTQVVIVVDQLEELFAQSAPSEAAAFLDALASAAADPHAGVKIVATLRADFYDHPLRHPAFGELLRLSTEVITPMTPPELEQAISGPAAGVGVSFESGLVTQIAADVAGQPNSLPLLQYALTELFERRTGSTIPLTSYRELGGVSGALARRADSIYDSFESGQRSQLREVFLRLVTLTDGAADTRRRALVRELSDAAGADVSGLVESFGRHRLVTLDRDPVTRGATVEIAHEALLHSWARLRDWIEDARADVVAQRALASSAHEWRERDRDTDFLLAGARLARYEGWLVREPVSLTDGETQYLQASEDATARDIDRERQRVRRLRRLVVGFAGALVIALVAGGIAFREQRRATAQTQRAEQATLLSRSAAATSDDPELALLLALEANERDPSDASRRALLGALGSASTANRVLSRQPLDGDCIAGSDSFYTNAAPGLADDGPVQLQVIDGQALARDVVSGETVDLGPMPFPCALGGSRNGYGGAGDIEGRIWVGPDFLELDVRGFVLASTPTRTMVGALSPDGGSELRLFDNDGAPVGSPIPSSFINSSALTGDSSLFAASFGLEAERTGNGFVAVVDATSGEILSRIEGQIAGALGFDPTTGDLIVGFADGTIATFDPLTGDQRSQVATDESFGYLAAGARADGTLIMVSRGGIQLVDRSVGPVGSPFPLQDVREAFVRRDGLVVAIRNDRTADVYDLEANALVAQTHDAFDRSWIATSDGVAAVLQERPNGGAMVELIDLSTGDRTEPDLAMPDGSTFPAVAVYPAPEGYWAVSADHRLARWRNDDLVEELDMGSGPEVRNDEWYAGLRSFGDWFAALGVRPDGAIEASLITVGASSTDEAEVLFTVDTGMNHQDDANGLGMAHPSAGGGLFVVDQTGELTEFGPDGDVVSTVATGFTTPVAIALDPTGSTLAISFLDGGGVVVIDVATGESETIPGDFIASSLGFDDAGSLLAISVWGGEVRLYGVGSGEVPPIIWDGTGTFGAEPGWFDASSRSLWIPASGKVIEIPLDPEGWVAKACSIVGRDLTAEEWERFVPGNEPVRGVCE